MLALWRRVHRLEPARSDCSIEVFEGYDVAAAMRLDMRQWYLGLLDSAEVRYLVTDDITDQLTLTRVADGVWQMTLPVDVRRLITLRVSGCPRATVVQTANERAVVLNTNRLVRSGTANPVAVADGKEITLYCKTADGTAPAIVGTQAVVDPGDEWYVFDEAALSLIPNTPDYLNE